MFLNGFILHDEPCTDPYARFCGQTEASASSDPMASETATLLRVTGGCSFCSSTRKTLPMIT